MAAFLLFGFWKAGTPLLIASTPVSAVHPEANDRSSKNASASRTALSANGCASSGASSGASQPGSAGSTYTRDTPVTPMTPSSAA